MQTSDLFCDGPNGVSNHVTYSRWRCHSFARPEAADIRYCSPQNKPFICILV